MKKKKKRVATLKWLEYLKVGRSILFHPILHKKEKETPKTRVMKKRSDLTTLQTKNNNL